MTEKEREIYQDIKQTLKNIELILDFIGVIVVAGIIGILVLK